MSKLNGKSRRLRDAGDAGRSVVDSQAGADATYAESEQQFRVLAESMPQLAWMANADGWVFWYNKRWYDYTGTTSHGSPVSHERWSCSTTRSRWSGW
jgi:PAS domain-containing protein